MGAVRTEPSILASILIIALAPYATIGLPFVLGTRLQVAIILIGLLVAVVPVRHGLTRLRTVPRPLFWGLGLYAAAAAWGAAVGLLEGNPPYHVAGQLISMALLPLAAIVYALRGAALRASTVVAGLGLAAAAALAAHGLGHALGFAGSRPGGATFRLVLPPNVDFAAPALLTLLVACAWWLATRSRAALAAALVAAVLVVGSQSRGLWLAALLGLALLVAGAAGSFPRRRAVMLAAVALVVAGAVAAVGWWAERGATVVARLDYDRPHPELVRRGLEPDPARGLLLVEAPAGRPRRYTLFRARRPVAGRAIALSVRLRGAAGQEASLWLTPRADPPDRPTAVGRRFALTASGVWQTFGAVVPLTAAAEEPAVVLRVRGGERWEIDALELRAYGTPVTSWLHDLSLRSRTLAQALARPAHDPTLGYRLREWHAIRDSWREGGWERVLTGHGLGALFAFPSYRLVGEGERVPIAETNYIHNFYLFLAYKLGLAGGLALIGLGWIAIWSWRVGRADGLAAAARALPRAVAAAWAAFGLWGLSSPELVNFRVAPLWGLLIAACWSSIADAETAGDARRGARRAPPEVVTGGSDQRNEAYSSR